MNDIKLVGGGFESPDDPDELPESTINQIQLPNGSIYGFEDTDAREAVVRIASDLSEIVELEEQVNSLNQSLAQIESAGTATNAHSVGEYVMISDALYKVTASVAKGDTWAIGTNVTAANIGSEIGSLKSALAKQWEKIYPVGSIYMSVNATDPAKLFGGQWLPIGDRFLLAAGYTYKAGSTGGGVTHSHKYGIQFGAYWGSISMEADAESGVLQGGTGNPVGIPSGGVKLTDSLVNNGAETSTKTTQTLHYRSIADTSSASNMPPYLAVYVWKRTA